MSEPLNRIPVYQQLNQRLRALLGDKDYAPGRRFLTEREIATRFAVSRATANKALSNLIAEGLLEYRKGLGTYVRSNHLDNDLRALVSFTARAQASGTAPETRVLAFALTRASALDPSVAAALEVGGDDAVATMERLRLADGQPLILEWRAIRGDLVPGIASADVQGSIYQLFTERYRLRLGGCDQAIAAVNLDRAEAHRLGTAVGAAGLEVRSVGYLEDARALWHERTLYRGDGYTFRNRLGRLPNGARGPLVADALSA